MSDLIFLFGKVDAVPTPPANLIEKAFKLKKLALEGNFSSDTYRDTTHRPSLRTLYKDGKEFQNAFTNTVITEEYYKWATENIVPGFNDIRISITTIGNHMNGPHIDITRGYTLLYLLDHGGEDHETCFYREQDSTEMFRPLGYCVDDYSKLEIVAKAKLQVNRWSVINASVLHSIENIPNGRLSIQLSFNKLPELKFIDPVYTQVN